MRLTGLILLIWQAGKIWRIFEERRQRRRRRAFWERHEKNMEAIRIGNAPPYPNNCFDWKGGI